MSNTSRVYIGQLSYEIRENDVEDFFKGYGKIRDINLKQGYGFVEFDDYRDANDAVHDLNGKHMLGEKIRVEMARGRGRFMGRRGGMGGGYYRSRFMPRRGYGSHFDRRSPLEGYPERNQTRNCAVLIKNLPKNFSSRRLKDFVASQVDGEIVSSNAHKEKREALFEFRRSSEAESAIKKLDGTKFDGEYITVEDARASYVGDKSSRSRSSSSEDNGKRSESPARRQASLSDGDD
uniref:RRM domain-containing protein n=1 Tax=Trichuris muris TaxID=70415 RepID=A0A5S6R6B9_TRIMR